MIPLGSDFVLLYAIYGGILILLLTGAVVRKESKSFKNNLLFFIVYSFVWSFFFLDASNFKGGSSLVVLFYGMLFLIVHLVIFILRRIYVWIKK